MDIKEQWTPNARLEEYQENARTMLRLFKSDESAMVIADYLSKIMNTSSEMVNAFIEEVKGLDLQQQKIIVVVILGWLNQLHKQCLDDNYDGRNESSVKFGSILYSIPEVQALETLYLLPVNLKDALELFSRTHRTIQSEFTGVCLKLIDMLEKEDCIAFDKLREKINE